MSVTPNDYVAAPDDVVAAAPDDVVAAAPEFIRGEGDACVVSIYRLLDELSDMFGDRFPVSPDTYKALDLIQTLWADPHVDQVPYTESIEFAWNEKGFDHDLPAIGLKASLLGCFQIPSAPVEET
jgi:hypothetical protein